MEYKSSANTLSTTINFDAMRIAITMFIVLSAICSCKNKKETISTDKPNSKNLLIDSLEILRPSLWVYGMFREKDRQLQQAAQIYKFLFLIKGGCFVSDTLMDVAEKHNKVTDSILKIRLGENWRDRFENTADSLFAVDSIAIAIAKSDKYIFSFDTATEKHNVEYNFYPNLRYTTHATVDKNIKVVSVEGYGLIDGKVTGLNYLRASVDLKLTRVINIDKTAYKEYP